MTRITRLERIAGREAQGRTSLFSFTMSPTQGRGRDSTTTPEQSVETFK